MGTADYMAPEQAVETHTVDIRADVYSLGCTIYKLLTGHAPFNSPVHDTPLKRVMGHARDPVPPIRDRRNDVPEELAEIVEQLLAKRPDERPPTPQAVAEAMATFAGEANLTTLAEESKPPATVSASQLTEEHLRTHLTETAGAHVGVPAPAAGGRRFGRVAVLLGALAAAVLCAVVLRACLKRP